MSRPCHRGRATVIAAAVLVALTGAAAPARTAPGESRLLIQFKPAASRNAVLAAVGARMVRTVPDLGLTVAAVPMGRAQAALTSLRRSRAVSHVEPDALAPTAETLPADPSFPTQFAVNGGAWGWYATHTTQAWDITRGAPSVVVAVLDTGLKTQGLSDFDGQVVPGWNVLANTSDTSSNAGNHGTYVAGVVGLAADNGVGNAGYCPGCRIMPVQVGTDSGAYLSDMATGITWATDHGARVINLSFAGAIPSTTIDDAVSYARSKGVVVVAAAGNANCDCSNYPAAAPGVLSVAGTTSTDAKQSDSDYGTWVKVAAPENNMTSWPVFNGAPGYAQVGGTSMAAPVVAALAGLLFSAEPALSGAQVEQALESSAAPVGFPVAYGRVDALAALNAVGLADPQPAVAPQNVAAPRVLIETNGSANAQPLTAAPQVGQVLLRGQGAWTGAAPLALASVQWQRCGTTCSAVGSSSAYTVQSADAGFALRLVVAVRNGYGTTVASSAATALVGASSTPANTAPPTVSGSAAVGQSLSASPGSWSGSPTSYAYQWLRCASTCSAISGATAASYAVQSADAGYELAVSVTAANDSGSAVATSAPTTTVAGTTTAPPPTSTSSPVVSGTAQVGRALTASSGSWTGSPTSYAYQWLRCSSACTAVADATAAGYTVQSADAGYALAVTVTATNAAGAATSTSSPTAVVPVPAPVTQTLTFTGALNQKQTSQTFSLAAGAGASTAQLSFSKCSSLTLGVQTSLGGTVATGSGPSVLSLAPTLAGGSYAYTVSGGRCGFTLTVTTNAP